MGNRGGFNPYRDKNGEYASINTSGRPGRSRNKNGGRGRADRCRR